MPAQSAILAALSGAAVIDGEFPVEVADCGRLLELLGLVSDPRKRRGVGHSIAAILAIAAAAVLAGSWSVLAIGEWAAQAPQVVLVVLGARRNWITGRFTAPHVDTFRRVLRRPLDADAFDAAIGLFLAERLGMGASEPLPGSLCWISRDPTRVLTILSQLT